MRKTFGDDPLSIVIPEASGNTAGDTKVTAIKREVAPVRKRATYHLSPELIERVTLAAYWERETQADIVERALRREIERMEAERGEPYKPR